MRLHELEIFEIKNVETSFTFVWSVIAYVPPLENLLIEIEVYNMTGSIAVYKRIKKRVESYVTP